MKIALVEPIRSTKIELKETEGFYKRDSSHSDSGSSVSVREPIALGYLGAVLQKEGHEVSILQQNAFADDEILEIIRRKNPGVVGFSALTYTSDHALHLAKRIKQELREIPIIFGGYHSSGFPELAKEEAVDFVVIGEGEETVSELVSKIERNGNLDDVKGTAIFKDGKVKINPRRERVDFSKLPWPLRDKEILRYAKAAPLAYPSPPNQVSAAQISYSRGCPYACGFCPSNSVFGKRTFFREPSDVVDEIQYLQEEFGTNFLFFNDLTFSAGKRRYLALMKEMIDRNVNINWFAMANVGLDSELAHAMVEARCSRIGIGIESVLDEQLRVVKPHQNYQREVETLQLCDQLGMLTRAYLMVGYPDETEESLGRTLEKAKDLPIDQIRFGFVTPFPGTPFYEQNKGRVTKQFSEFTGDVPVIQLDSISEEDILRVRKEMLHSFYSSQTYLDRALDKTRRFPHLAESFGYMFDYLSNAGIVPENKFGGGK
jgi:anaerobic magnesium-protoporphyrin IX monomethyl ester cyclase